MAKPNPLATGLKSLEGKQQPAPAPLVVAAVPSPKSKRGSKSRDGRVLVGGFFAPEVHKQLKQIALDEDKTLQEVLTEAIDHVFARAGKPTIATLSHE